jgi:hypothetical protein
MHAQGFGSDFELEHADLEGGETSESASDENSIRLDQVDYEPLDRACSWRSGRH